MPGTRAPWWMYVVAAAFALTFCFNLWQEAFGPAGAGFVPVWPTLIAARVLPGSPVDKAGMRAGDVIESVDGRPVRERPDWFTVRTNFEIGRPIELQVRRGDEHLRLRFVISTPGWRAWDSEDYLVLSALGGSRFILLLLAIFVAFSRPGQLSARLAALMFASLAVAEGYPPYGWGAALRRLPAVLSLPICLASTSWLLGSTAWLSFFAVFPRPSLTRRWQWALVLLPAIIFVPPIVAWGLAMIYAPARALGMPWRFVLSAVAVGLAQDVAGVALLLRNYRRAEDANDRRRLRTLLFATCVGLIAGLAWVQPWSYPLKLVGVTVFVFCPLSFAYAVLRHRLFDIRVIIRQGLQYALARRVIVSAMPAAIALLVVDLIAKFTLAGTLAGTGHVLTPGQMLERLWLDGVVGAGIVLVYKQHQRWLDALDRRFFRERYDANRLLREVVEEVRRAARFEVAAPIVVSRIESALHPEFVALFLRESGQPAYTALAASPGQASLPRLPADSKVVGLLRLLDKPLELSGSDSGWQRELPQNESALLSGSRIDLLVPVVLGDNKPESLLALGPRRSEEPYSREDKDLLRSITVSLALLLDRPSAAPAAESFQECPDCGTCCESDAHRCPRDGSPLTVIYVPRSLGGRYSVERRIGRGGMGTVYAALDSELRRRVAAKLIREDLVGDSAAAQRFRREAQAAAGFAHPNVVTVHDFGVAAGRRAFLIMELLEGNSLRQELTSARRLPPARILEVLRGVCAALQAAHEQHLVHRDLKPENIFIARVGTVEVPKLLDFGLAKFLPVSDAMTADTGTGALVGTPRYMAPEQLRGQAVDPAWDLWAVAVTAYEMLCGEHPFAAPSAAECQKAILEGRFTPVGRYLPDARPELDSFFDAALSLTPAHRPSSALAFLQELERVLAGLASTASP